VVKTHGELLGLFALDGGKAQRRDEDSSRFLERILSLQIGSHHVSVSLLPLQVLTIEQE
jgi:hypothetical protein